MRYRKILFLVCLLPLLSKGQTYFNNYYKTGYNNTASTHVFNNPADSSFTVFNYANDSVTGYQGLYCTNISKTGILNFKKTLTYPNYDYYSYLNGLKQFIPATNCSYFGASVTYTSSFNTLLFTKINKVTLDTIKTSFYYDGIYSYYMNNLIKFNANKYYLIGNKSNSSSQWPCVFQLDSNLNIVTTFTISNPFNMGCSAATYDLVNKKLILCGRRYNSSNHPNNVIMICDTLGAVSTASLYPTYWTNGVSQSFYSGIDNTIVTIGGIQTSLYANNYEMYRLQICKYDLNLNPIWKKTYGRSTIINTCYSGVINNDGSLVVACGYGDSTSLPLVNEDINGTILKVNSNGDSLWMRQYSNYVTGSSPANYWETFYGIEKTLDGGYILCGSVVNKPQGKAWIVKTDSLGCVSFGCGNLITEAVENTNSKKELVLFPNPSSDILNIDFDPNDKYTKAQVINSLGQIVKEDVIELELKKYSIDIKDLPEGVYLLNLKSLGSTSPTTVNINKRFVIAR
ncbi:MAG: T9SS type A sorting domain-containing protein [Bacteroidetes bacterium]|nr:T9SS type A sorting domain-containing protein [Bacteroidota bacterium]